MNCGGEFILSDKQKKWEISTPNYPNIPPTYSECTWKVSAPMGERLSIHFPERFDLSNTKEWVLIEISLCWKAYNNCREKIEEIFGRKNLDSLKRNFHCNNISCEREYVDIRDGGTDGSRLMGRFCKDVAPSTMTTIGNMMYIYFYTDVPEPKNGFKAVITSGGNN